MVYRARASHSTRGAEAMNSRFYRDDIRWDDGNVIHACEGDRMVPFDHGTFLVWTRCGLDVPASAGYAGGELPNCPSCTSQTVDASRDGK